MINASNTFAKRHIGFLTERIKVYVTLLKARLTLLVALSAGFGYTLAAGDEFSWLLFMAISAGGFLITGSSNVLNQVFEKEYDAKMRRTASRPVPTEKVNQSEAIVYALLLCILGMSFLGYYFNLPTALLGIIGLLSYAFVYTPMKRHSPFAVFIGAIPGALPPLIGWVAVTGVLDREGLILFAFQFFWQFPHFWAIAWLADADYKKAGFRLLPSGEGKSPTSSRLILIYSLMLLPLLILPFQANMLNQIGLIGLGTIGTLYILPAWKLHRSQSDKDAKRLLFASFLYLPVMQLIFLLCH